MPNWSQCAAGLCKHHAKTEKCTLDRLLNELSVDSVHFSYNATFLVLYVYTACNVRRHEYRIEKKKKKVCITVSKRSVVLYQ